MTLVKLSAEHLAMVGASNGEDFPAKLSAFTNAAKSNEAALAQAPSLTDLQSRLSTIEKTVLTEGRVAEIASAATPKAISDFLSSEAGKALIGAEASRIVMESSAATGTIPAKTSPAPAEPEASNIAGLEAQGKFEEAWALNKTLQAEFRTPKQYAAFRRAGNSLTLN